MLIQCKQFTERLLSLSYFRAYFWKITLVMWQNEGLEVTWEACDLSGLNLYFSERVSRGHWPLCKLTFVSQFRTVLSIYVMSTHPYIAICNKLHNAFTCFPESFIASISLSVSLPFSVNPYTPVVNYGECKDGEFRDTWPISYQGTSQQVWLLLFDHFPLPYNDGTVTVCVPIRTIRPFAARLFSPQTEVSFDSLLGVSYYTS